MFRKNNELQGHGSIRKNKIYGTVGVIIFGIIAMFSLHKSVAADDIESPKTTAPIPIAEASDTSLVVQSQMARQEDNTTLTTTKADSATTMNSTSRAAATAPTAAASQAMLSTAQTENQNPNVTVENQELKDAVTEAKNNGIEAKQEATENIGTANTEAEVATLEAEANAREKEQAKRIKEAIEKYKNDLAVAQANTTKPGYLSEVVTQGLKFENEPNAHLSITGTTEFGQQDMPKAMSYEEYVSSGKKFANNPVAAYTTTLSGRFVIPKIDKGQTITATYTNLQNSSYNGKKIAKVVYEVTNLNSGTGIIGFAEKDPTKGIYTFYNLSAPSRYGVKIRFYDEDDNLIQFNQDNPAILALTSLSKTILADGKTHEEGITDYNFKPVKITGSYVEKQSDNRLAATTSTAGITDSYDNPDFYKTSIAGVTENGSVISFTMRRYSEFDKGYWLAITSKLPSPFVLTKPNLSYKFFSYNKAGTVLLDNYIQGTTTKLTETQTVKPKGTLIGESYTGTHEDRITFNGKVYKYVSSSDNITGTVKLGITNVYNSYVEVTGNVIVNYRNQAGETIKESVEDTPNTSIGANYDTTEHRQTTIVTSNGKTYELLLDQLPSNEQGKVSEGTTEVTYVYKEVFGNVTVHYQDESGHQLQADVKVVEGASTNTPYDTTPHALATIVTPDGKTYERVSEKTKGQEKGQVVKGTTEVTYVYKEVFGNVTVHYQDESGHQLQADVKVVEGASTNTPYDTTPHALATIVTPDGKTYERVSEKTKGQEKGQVVKGTTEVTYVYKEVFGNVTVHYQDESGHQLQADVKVVEGASTNTPYDTTPHALATIVTPDGKTYERVSEKTKGQEKGQVVKGTTEVTYVYKEVFGNVTVHYQDESGHQLQADVKVVEGASTNTPYDTTPHALATIVTPDGKTYERVSEKTKGQEKGQVVKGTTEVTYVYKEVFGNVTVHYQDESGHQLQADVKVVEGASTNTPYDTTPHALATIVTPDGKTYERVSEKTKGQEKGQVVKGTTEVTYVYKEVFGNVTVHYQDESGHQLQADVKVVEGASTNTPYDTTPHALATIVTPDGKTYERVSEKTKGQEKGQVVKGTTEVTYVYKEVFGNVTVHYQDESGHQLQADVKVVEGASTNTPYDTTPHALATIVTPDGKTYERVSEKTKGQEKGQVVKGTTEVTYVYKEVFGNVTVHYQDESGHQLQADVKVVEGASTNTPYDTTPHALATIVTPDGKTYERVSEKTKGQEKGQVVKGTTEVTYVYKEVFGNVTVHYQDESGHQLQADVKVVEGASTNTPYDTTPHALATIVTPDGKTYERVSEKTKGQEKGQVVKGTTEVTYVYKEVFGNVTVHYQDESGHQLQADVKVVEGASTNTPYDTTPHALATIVTPDGKTYERVSEKTKGQEKGQVVKGTTEVTYVYKEVFGLNKQKVTYTVIDDTTGTTLENQVELTTGHSGTNLPTDAQTKYDQMVAAYQAKGYELVSKDELPAKFDLDSSHDQNVTVHLKHGTAESQESKKVSLTVRYHGAGSQTPADNVQTATWTRTVTKDKVTGDVVKTTDWVADKATYDAVPSPVIPGYTVDVATVSAETVTQEDMVKDVYYTAIPVTPDKPTPPVVPSTPDKPTTPTVVPTTPTKATPTKTEILPSTGDSQVGPTLATLTGVSLLLSAFGYIGRRKKED
ncbi:MucBP domain-containing protein [Streptococcus anginosus]|uniref:MucBP domain-containing protein n=1 Tax=Streptococcus anginosus TaxID=1328 RepID=UPI003D35E29C